MTAALLFIGVAAGTVLGVALSFATRNSGRSKQFLDAIALAVAATPALVVLFWLHYPAQQLAGVVIAPFWTASLCLVLLQGFAVYRIAADSISTLPKQYLLAAQVCGLDARTTFWRIEAPILLRNALPRWLDQAVVILHTTLFASLISVDETFRVAQRVNAREYHPVAIYSIVALLFVITAGPLMILSKRMQRSVFRDESER